MKVVGGDALELKLYNASQKSEDVLLKQMVSAVDFIKENVIAKLSGSVLQRKSGRLIDSIHGEVTLGNGIIVGRVFSDGSVPYFAIQERGGRTRPHDIVPRNARALRFEMSTTRGSRAVSDLWFATRIHHPGSRIPAHRFMLNTLREFRQIQDRFFNFNKLVSE